MLLLKNCDVYSPEPLGKNDILICNGKIVAIQHGITVSRSVETVQVDCSGLKAVPGLIDGHVHFAGAGGEGGPSSRTPELQLGDFVEAGVTTAIGMLGTDGYMRFVETVLMKARALKTEGISAYVLTGSYQVPTPTLTGDIARDMILIPEIIGAGEIAVSDHRSSVPGIHELARLIKSVRLAGLLSGKTGVTCIHIGDAPRTFEPLIEAVEMAGISFRHVLPTHCNRSETVFERAVTFARRGGYVDLTTSAYPFYSDEEVKPSTGVMKLLAEDVPANHICMSSDAGGSLPDFDSEGNLKGSQVGKLKSIYTEMTDLVLGENLPLEQAVRFASANVADVYGLAFKGYLKPDFDADIVLIDAEFNISHLLAMGRFLLQNGQRTSMGKFEKKG